MQYAVRLCSAALCLWRVLHYSICRVEVGDPCQQQLVSLFPTLFCGGVGFGFGLGFVLGKGLRPCRSKVPCSFCMTHVDEYSTGARLVPATKAGSFLIVVSSTPPPKSSSQAVLRWLLKCCAVLGLAGLNVWSYMCVGMLCRLCTLCDALEGNGTQCLWVHGVLRCAVHAWLATGDWPG